MGKSLYEYLGNGKEAVGESVMSSPMNIVMG